MKALLITLEFPPAIGGAEHYFYECVKRLHPSKIIVLAPKAKGTESFDSSCSFRVIRSSFLHPLFFPHWLPLFFTTILVCLRFKIRLIWAGQILPVGTAAALAGLMLKIPFGVHGNGMDLTIPQSSRWKKKLMRFIIRRACFFTTISSYTQKIFHELGAGDNNITLIYPCPSLRVSLPETFQTQSETKKESMLLTVGRLVKRKGHDTVIRSLPLISQQFPHIAYVIVGEGPERQSLEELSRTLRVQTFVHFKGSVSHENILSYYAACDIFIMTPRELSDHDVEGFGIVYVEAGLFGKPVIGGRSGGVADAVEHGVSGLLVDPNSPKEIADAVCRLLKDRSFALRLGSQGKKRARNMFSWDKQASKLENIFSVIEPGFKNKSQ